MKLADPVRTLPEAEPARDPAPAEIRLPIANRPPPADAEGRAGWARAMAERQAMLDLGYDPLVDGPQVPR